MKPEVVSGRASPKLTSSGIPERWHQGEVTFIVDESLTTVWADATVGVEQAFDTWRAADDKLPKIAFDVRKAGKVLLEPDGENRIYYAPIPVPGHESDLGVTLQYADQSTGEIVEADIIINSRHPFALLAAEDPAATTTVRGDPANSNEDGDSQGHGSSESKSGSNGSSAANAKSAAANAVSASGTVSGCKMKYDVASVVTHEIGHFWGLGEDMLDTTATMYFSTPPCNVMKRELKLDDVKAVSSLYTVAASDSAPSDSASSAKHCSVATLGGSRGDGAALLLVAAALGTAARRRRARRPRG